MLDVSTSSFQYQTLLLLCCELGLVNSKNPYVWSLQF
jgi:hypothetical protein